MLLVAPVLVATILLGLSGQLVLYIHPRYVIFTMVLSGLALVILIATVLVRRRPHVHADHEEHDAFDDPDVPRGRSRVVAIATFVTASVAAVLLLALPPATLSSETASQRDLIGGSSSADAETFADADSAPTAAFAAFTVLEWSALLRQTQDPAFYGDKPVDIVGFISPDPAGSPDIFYVSRFKITCCAVDAAPSAIPVHYPDWRTEFAADDWVQVEGGIATNPSSDSELALAVLPASVTPVEEPGDPYLY